MASDLKPEDVERITGLPDEDVDFLAKAASLFIPQFDLVLYGSRSKGYYEKYSDVDMAVFGTEEPFDIDVTRFYQVADNSRLAVQPKIVQKTKYKPASFLKNVVEDGIPIYEGCGDFRKARKAMNFGPPAAVRQTKSKQNTA